LLLISRPSLKDRDILQTLPEMGGAYAIRTTDRRSNS
jgi:hypothetical protein